MSSLGPPGVRFEFVDTPARPIPSRYRTDVVGFVGFAARGPLHVPVAVESWEQYRTAFGGFEGAGYLPYAVRLFFENGGRKSFVVRVADPAVARTATRSVDLVDPQLPPGSVAVPQLRLEATSPGSWGDGVSVTFTAGARGLASVQIADGESRTRLLGVSLRPEDERYLPRILSVRCDRCGLMSVSNGRGLERVPGFEAVCECGPLSRPRAAYPLMAHPDPRHRAELQLPPGTFRLEGGVDGIRSCTKHHVLGMLDPIPQGLEPERLWGLSSLLDLRDVSVVVIPDAHRFPTPDSAEFVPTPPEPPWCGDLMEPAAPEPLFVPPPAPTRERPPSWSDEESREIVAGAVRFCELRGDCVALVDPPVGVRDAEAVEVFRGRLTPSHRAGLYWPWVVVRHELRQHSGAEWFAVPPAGAVAGLTARLDLSAGPHRTPAGHTIQGAAATTEAVADDAHAWLNEIGVNVLRARSARGVVLEGARSTSDRRTRRYLNVERALIAIRDALGREYAGFVFEGNGAVLRTVLGDQLRLLLGDLWRRGWLTGGSAAEAFDVICDETTNPPEVVEQGMVVAEIRLRIPPPIEWLVVRIGRSVQGVETFEVGGVR